MKNEIIIDTSDLEIKLGEKIENNFTVKALKEKFPDEDFEPNYIYFRARSNDAAKLQWLSDKFVFMSIIPLDREIIHGGSYYIDPELKEGEERWYYFVKTTEEYNDVLNQDIETEVIDELCLFTKENAGQGARYGFMDFLDDVYDAVTGFSDIRCPYGKVSVYNTVESLRYEEIQHVYTKHPADNYPEKGWMEASPVYSPVKNVMVVADQSIGMFLGVPPIWDFTFTDKDGKFEMDAPFPAAKGKVRISIRFQNDNATLFALDSNLPVSVSSALTGVFEYYEDHYVEGLSNMDIRFERNSAYAKYATIMNALSDYNVFCSEYGITAPKHLKIFGNNYIKNSCAPLTNYLASYHSSAGFTAQLYNSFFGLTADGIPVGITLPDIIIDTELDNLNVSDRDGTELTMTEAIYKSVFHELSHASHFFGLGENAMFVWTGEYIDMIGSWYDAYDRGESPFDNCYNNGGTDLIKLIESWGYFSENYAMAWKFRNKSLRRVENGDEIADCSEEYPVPESKRSSGKYAYTKTSYKSFDGLTRDYIKYLEEGLLDNPVYDEENNLTGEIKSLCYFSYDGFYDLIDCNQDSIKVKNPVDEEDSDEDIETEDDEYDEDDTAEEYVFKQTDFTQGYTYSQIFDALTCSSINSLGSFELSLLKRTGRVEDYVNVRKTIEENVGYAHVF